MKRWIAILAGVSLLGLAGCRDNDDNTTGAATTATGPAATTAAGATPSPALTGSADEQCLIAGSPWEVSKPDLESQMRQVMHGINVTGVHIVGEQTLTVTPDLHATILDHTTTTISASMSNNLTLVITQKHTGQTAGQWKINGNDLNPQGDWNGAIHVDTKATINGRSGNMPVDVPSLGSIPLTFTCADGSLNLSTPKSPFVWLFR
ncbi:hypothetical protein [Paractinoplanes globisporus]|uniref:Lipoprotein n=1 Tax=Paractinoplanes globisporus TaxID=113565 RepID=A0ABW6WCN4_9ACTN|nr:hypothetical protein [Actinoplanes globisporus]